MSAVRIVDALHAHAQEVISATGNVSGAIDAKTSETELFRRELSDGGQIRSVKEDEPVLGRRLQADSRVCVCVDEAGDIAWWFAIALGALIDKTELILLVGGFGAVGDGGPLEHSAGERTAHGAQWSRFAEIAQGEWRCES